MMNSVNSLPEKRHGNRTKKKGMELAGLMTKVSINQYNFAKEQGKYIGGEGLR